MNNREKQRIERMLDYRHIYIYEEINNIKFLKAVVTSIQSVADLLSNVSIVSAQTISNKIDTGSPVMDRFYISSYHRYKTTEIERIIFQKEVETENLIFNFK